MSGENSTDNNSESGAEKKLMTLDQLSQTIQVITGVVNRLKRHLNMQLLNNTTLSRNETDQTIELSRELLINERELQELQQLAFQQRNAVLGGEDSLQTGAHEGKGNTEQRKGFIVEISRLDENHESGQDRILH